MSVVILNVNMETQNNGIYTFFLKESSVADLQDLSQIEIPEVKEEPGEEKGDKQHGEKSQWIGGGWRCDCRHEKDF